MSDRFTTRSKKEERMIRISEGTNETGEDGVVSPKLEAASRKSSSSSSSSSSSPQEVPHLWKEEGGSAQDNVARRTRSVTFLPNECKDTKLGKRISYFSVQKPWVQKTFREMSSTQSESSTHQVDQSVDSIFTTDESILKRTMETSFSDTTKSPACTDKDKTESIVEEQSPGQASLKGQEEDIVVEECRDDDESESDEESGDVETVATKLKFNDLTQTNFKDSMGDAPSQIELKNSLQDNTSPPEKPNECSPISPNRRMSMLSGDLYEPPTNLHDICYNAQSPKDLLAFQDHMPRSSPGRNKLKDISRAVSQRDGKGRTPLHLISQNHAISGAAYPTDDDSIPGLQLSSSTMTEASSQEKRQVTTFILDVILAANPMAMKLEDANGHIPFERALVEWIHIMHNVESPKSRSWGLASRRFSSYSRLSAPSRIQHMWHSTSQHMSSAVAWAGKSLPFASESMQSMGTAPDNSSPKKTDDIEGGNWDVCLSDIEEEQGIPDDASWALDHFPSNVQLTSHVKFAISLLSTILDHLDEYAPIRSFRRRSIIDRRSNGSNQTRDSFDVAMDEFREFCFTESADVIANDVVQEIAAIPYLVKTMLLLEDEEREWVFSTSLFRRIIMSEKSIGPWLTGMLQSSKKGVAQRALQYLAYLSDTLEAYPKGWGIQSTKSSLNVLNQSLEAHSELHDKMSELEGFIPSLLALDERKIEEAATTLVVRQVLDRMISKPFAVSIVLLDSIFLTLLIISFRAACKIFLTGGTNGALYWIYVANSCTFYFIIRELGKGITIMERTKRARTYFLSFWTLTDILSIILALSSTVAMRVQFKQETIDYASIDPLRGLLATTTGLLWLRVLSLLKSINSQLATFVLAIIQISRDILMFMVIMSVLVVSFSQMFFTILVPPECATGNPPPDKDVCGSAEYYLQTYTILLGDFGTFERETFATVFSLVLIVVFSFMVVIVLLNVLIAIVGDSYEKCLLRSQSLFGRARVMLIAELVSFQNLLRASSREDPPESIYSKWWYGTFGDHRWSRGTALFFLLSGLVVLIWFIAETVGYFRGKRVGNYIFSLASILVNVILFVVIVRLLSNNAKEQGDGSRRVLNQNRCCGYVWKWYDNTIQKAMLHLLGSDQDKKSNHFFARKKKRNDPDEEWSGRAHYLQREMTRLAEESALMMSENTKAIEQNVSSSETRLRSEVKTVEEYVTAFKTEIMYELRSSEQRLEEMMKESMKQLLQALSEQD